MAADLRLVAGGVLKGWINDTPPVARSPGTAVALAEKKSRLSSPGSDLRKGAGQLGLEAPLILDALCNAIHCVSVAVSKPHLRFDLAVTLASGHPGAEPVAGPKEQDGRHSEEDQKVDAAKGGALVIGHGLEHEVTSISFARAASRRGIGWD